MKGARWICGVLLLLATRCHAQQPAAKPANRSPQTSPTQTTQENRQLAQTALALEQQGKSAEAAAAWAKLVKVEPNNASAFAHLGILEAREEHYAEAITHYRKALALQPTMSQLKLNLGLAFFKSENFAESANVFEDELKKHVGDQRLTILAGMSEYGLQHYSTAAGYLKEAASRDTQNLPLRLTLAHCYLWTKQLDATMEVYKEILAINSESAEADMIAGEALDGKGDSAGAVQQFRAAEKINPREPNVHFGLAYLLWGLKRYDEAILEFKAELENDPKNYQAMIYLGDTYVRQNQFDQAKPILEQAAQFQPTVPLIHLDLGIVYMETENNEEAMRELHQAVTLEPDNVNAHFRLAKIYQSMGKRDEAKVEFAKASSLNKKTDEDLHKRIEEGKSRPNAKPAPPAKTDTP